MSRCCFSYLYYINAKFMIRITVILLYYIITYVYCVLTTWLFVFTTLPASIDRVNIVPNDNHIWRQSNDTITWHTRLILYNYSSFLLSWLGFIIDDMMMQRMHRTISYMWIHRHDDSKCILLLRWIITVRSFKSRVLPRFHGYVIVFRYLMI